MNGNGLTFGQETRENILVKMVRLKGGWVGQVFHNNEILWESYPVPVQEDAVKYARNAISNALRSIDTDGMSS